MTGSPMKIAILTSGILPIPAIQGGAVETLVDFYLEYNDKHRLHDITVYSVNHPDIKKHPALKSEVNHYKYIKIDGWWAKIKRNIYHLIHGEEYYHYTIEHFLQEVIKDIQHQQYDVIVLENRPAYALKIKDVTNAKLVYHLHNEKLDSKALKCEEIYKAAYRILTVSNFIKSKVQTINPQDTKTKTVYNGIDLNAFSKKTQAIRYGVNNDDFLLVYSGRVNREKGIMELFEAIDFIKDKPQIKLMVIGSSFFGNATSDDNFMRNLKTKAAPMKDRIIFTGYIPYNEMPNYLSMADVAIIPSIWDDPFPTTVLEAQAMGLPIITTRRGGIPEEVTENSAVLLDTDEQFVPNLASAILDLYEHPEKRKQMAAASLERSKLFDKDRYAKDFFEGIE